jgi:putative ABC transport system ATP-binding protein
VTVERDSVFTISDVALRREATPGLEHVCAHIPAAACTAIVGRSGAGKSALLRLLTRLDGPDAGHITFHGSPLAQYDVLDLRRRVQLVAQQPVLLTDSVVDEIRLGGPYLDRAGVGPLLSRVGLPPSLLDRATIGLSGGEAQRVCLARALALQPEVLLSSPTSGSGSPATCSSPRCAPPGNWRLSAASSWSCSATPGFSELWAGWG